jgi:hypothetical protein
MKAKRSLPIYFFLITVLVFGCNKSEKAETKYQERIGYINPETSRYSENFKLCNDGNLFGGYYSSYAPQVYKNDKIVFSKHIQKNYKNKNYTDNGFLNLRFHINCEGQVGNVEVNELDENLELTSLNQELVQQLIDLSMAKNNWNVFEFEGHKVELESGNVLEILP